ncbi:MAG: DMT family transporter [Candidatus Eisenbacteria bacterium]
MPGSFVSSAFALAFASSLLYGSADFLGGIASRRARALAVTLLTQALGLLALVAAAWGVGGTVPRDAWGWATGAGLCGSIGVLLFYRALAVGTVSIVAPVTSAIALVVPVAAGLLAGERPGVLPLAGIALAPLAVVLVGGGGVAPGTEDARRAQRALVLAHVSGVLIGGFLVCVGRLPPGGGLWPLAIARAVGTVTIAAALVARRESPAAPRAAWAPILGCALLDVAANVCFRFAVARGALSLVATIVSLAPATTVLLARFVLHERLDARQKSGVAVALAAIVLLSRAG